MQNQSSEPEQPPVLPISSVVRGRLLIVLAAVMWSTSGWFVKNEAFHQWPMEGRGLVFAFWRALFAGLLVLPLARRPRLRPRLVPMTLCFALMNGSYLTAMTLTTAANAIWLQNTAPMWVFLMGLALREKISRDNLVLLAFGMAGVGTILYFEMDGPQLAGVVQGLIAGITYAGVVLFYRSMREENAAWLTSLNLLVTAAALGPFVVLQGLWIWPSGYQLLLLACFGLFQMGLPYVLFAQGLRSVPSQEGSGIALLEPILVPFWVLGVERPAWWTVVGGSLILLGLGVRYLGPLFRRNQSSPGSAER